MSPERVTHGFYPSTPLMKPYARNLLPSLVTPSLLEPLMDAGVGQSSVSLVQALPSAQNDLERPGFPTYAQYKQIETGYIQSLTPRRQGKALISQSMFDRIWDVLHYPESQLETAQFRFWARKMFTLNKNYCITLGVVDGQESPPQEVLLHDNLLVAIQEQLYDLLCYCHGGTGHGGRDKTCALIRKHYTWVPKDLVSNFIKACPTCIMKKCGNMDVNAQIPQLMAPDADKMSLGSARLISATGSQFLRNENSIPRTRSRRHAAIEAHESTLGYSENIYLKTSASLCSIPTLQDTTNPLVATSFPWVVLGHNQDLSLPSLQPVAYDDANNSIYSGNLGAYQYQPMVREVSLYKGLPNGWQYQHDDFATAHAEFMENKRQWDDTGNMASPMVDELQGFRNLSSYTQRIPEIAGLWGPEHFRCSIKEEEEATIAHALTHRPLHQYPVPPPMIHSLDMSDSCFPAALRDFEHHASMGTPHLSDHGYLPPIDPALLALSEPPIADSHSQSNALMYGQMVILDQLDESNGHAGMSTSSTANSIGRRVAIPLPLTFITNVQSGEGVSQPHLIAIQNDPNSASEEPEGELALSSTKRVNVRTTSSSSVETTRSELLSPFSPTGSDTTSTPPSSAATTPVDEAHDKSELKVPVAPGKGSGGLNALKGGGKVKDIHSRVQVKVEPL